MYHITDIITKAAVGITAVINLLSWFLNVLTGTVPQIYQHNNVGTINYTIWSF